MKKLTLILTIITTFFSNVQAQKKILLFVSQEQTYYSEYIVMKSALEDMGYIVEVFSASTSNASTYSASGNIEETAESLSGSSYEIFKLNYRNMFGRDWDSTLNNTPNNIGVSRDINTLNTMDDYEAMVIAGGTGILDYRVDGSYVSQGNLTALQMEQTALKLNSLGIDALQKGKVVLAQCHGASIPLYWRIPNTQGPGPENLGFSILKDGAATGYPINETNVEITGFNATHKALDRVVVSSPHSSLQKYKNGRYKLITSRDWYPQTIAFAAKTLVNILETFPDSNSYAQRVRVLIMHGGSVDSTNCSPANRLNDIPCNYGTGPNLPADYTDLIRLLDSINVNDEFKFDVSDINMLQTNLPYIADNETSVFNYINQYDVIIFYKHWSNGMTEQIQNAIVNFIKSGKGCVAMHHALYNDQFGKNILVDSIFKAQSNPNTWQGNIYTYDLINTNYGHYINTFLVNYTDTRTAADVWNSNPNLASSNLSSSYYPSMNLEDELYTNFAFENNAEFGNGIGQIQALFSNNQYPANQTHTSAFFTYLADSLSGRAVYLQVGERKSNYLKNTLFGRVIRNSVYWASNPKPIQVIQSVLNNNNYEINIFPNPTNSQLFIQSEMKLSKIIIHDLSGRLILESQKTNSINIDQLTNGIYIITCYDELNNSFRKKIIKN